MPKIALPICQSDIIKQNKNERVHKITNILIELDEINFNQNFLITGSIIVPTNHKSIRNAINNMELGSAPADDLPIPIAAPIYSKDLYRTFIDPCILDILSNVLGVVLCGGAALWAAMCLESPELIETKPKDWDLFLYNFDNENLSEEELRDSFLLKENAIIQIIEKYHKVFNIFKCKGVINILTKTSNIQIILRDYSSKDEIAISFDIPACSVVYDGENVYFTKFAAWSFINRLIVVMPKYRSTTYEKRLKKYFKKGFGLIFPKLKNFGNDKIINLPYLTLNICSKVTENIAIGWVDLPNLDVLEYTNIINNNITYDNISKHNAYPCNKVLENNIEEFCKGTNNFIQTHYYSRKNAELINPQYHVNNFQIGTIIREKDYNKIINRHMRLIIYKNSKYLYQLNTYIFDLLFLSSDNYTYFKNKIENIILEINKRIEGEIPVSSAEIIIQDPLTSQLREELATKYREKKNIYINWIININRDIELTGSLHPCGISANKWYGDYYYCYDNSNIDDINEESEYIHNITTSELDKILFDFTKSYEFILCPLCFENINYLQKNVITLKCGHLYHYSHSALCEGIKRWLKVKDNCPECRNPRPIIVDWF